MDQVWQKVWNPLLTLLLSLQLRTPVTWAVCLMEDVSTSV